MVHPCVHAQMHLIGPGTHQGRIPTLQPLPREGNAEERQRQGDPRSQQDMTCAGHNLALPLRAISPRLLICFGRTRSNALASAQRKC